MNTRRKRTPKAWAELPEAARRDALMLIFGERIMWDPKIRNWADEALPFCRMRWLSLGLAIKALGGSTRKKRAARKGAR